MTDSQFKDFRFESYHQKHLFIKEMGGIVIRIINTDIDIYY
jgi:hypothetical protein